MCETLQLNWKLPNPLKSTNLLNNNNNNAVANNRRKNNTNKPKTKSSGGRSKKNDDKYGLRACSIQKRIEVEGRKGQPKKRGPKPRPKPQPMSKYRRKTANLRERMRMGEINTAFENLREKIPTPLASNKGRCEKLTKINILHVAINYIRALESILDTGDAGVQVYGTSIVRSPIDSQFDGELQATLQDYCDRMQGQTKAGKLGRSVRKKQPSSSSSSSSSSSNSGSEDSGIVDEEMEHDNDVDNDDDDDEEDDDDGDISDDVECPDWTELTSTLEFPPVTTNLSEKPKLFPATKLPVRANMDTLLSTAAGQQQPQHQQQHHLQQHHNSGPFAVPFNYVSEFDSKRGVLQPLRPLTASNILANRQVSFSDLGGPDSSDLLGDLNVLEDALEASFGGINFVHEDPFQIFI